MSLLISLLSGARPQVTGPIPAGAITRHVARWDELDDPELVAAILSALERANKPVSTDALFDKVVSLAGNKRTLVLVLKHMEEAGMVLRVMIGGIRFHALPVVSVADGGDELDPVAHAEANVSVVLPALAAAGR